MVRVGLCACDISWLVFAKGPTKVSVELFRSIGHGPRGTALRYTYVDLDTTSLVAWWKTFCSTCKKVTANPPWMNYNCRNKGIPGHWWIHSLCRTCMEASSLATSHPCQNFQGHWQTVHQNAHCALRFDGLWRSIPKARKENWMKKRCEISTRDVQEIKIRKYATGWQLTQKLDSDPHLFFLIFFWKRCLCKVYKSLRFYKSFLELLGPVALDPDMKRWCRRTTVVPEWPLQADHPRSRKSFSADWRGRELANQVQGNDHGLRFASRDWFGVCCIVGVVWVLKLKDFVDHTVLQDSIDCAVFNTSMYDVCLLSAFPHACNFGPVKTSSSLHSLFQSHDLNLTGLSKKSQEQNWIWIVSCGMIMQSHLCNDVTMYEFRTHWDLSTGVCKAQLVPGRDSSQMQTKISRLDLRHECWVAMLHM